jgi:hypothetical protein
MSNAILQKFSYNQITDWSYRDTMAWWADGTSNQITFVEKFVPSWALTEDTSNGNGWYGGYQNSGAANSNYNIGRCISTNARLFGRSPNDPNRTTIEGPHANSKHGFETLGSMHPGIVNLLLGDGSVRAVIITTNPEIMWRLSNVQDGNTVSLP